jgi:DNA-binding CsgD family transcriptional regulator
MEAQISIQPRCALHECAAQAYSTLTRREREVLDLIASGRTNREIAESLVVSPETVKTHVRHVLGKFGVSRKVEIRALIRE